MRKREKNLNKTKSNLNFPNEFILGNLPASDYSVGNREPGKPCG